MATGRAAVAAGHEQTAAVGAAVLERGGNAADAVVAMCLAATVVEGTLTSLGGGGFIIVRRPGQDPVLIDAFVRQPGLGQPRAVARWQSFTLPLDGTVLRFGTGPASVAVPGLPAGLAHTARCYGRLALPELSAPAAKLATEGVVLTETQAGEHLLNFELFCRSDDGRAIYADPHTGQPRAVGERFRQPQLAETLEEFGATAAETFYRGRLAQRLLAWSEAAGGRITSEDLDAYRVIERPTLRLTARDVTVWTNPLPSMGGRMIVALLDQFVAAGAAEGYDDMRAARALVEVASRYAPPATEAPEDDEPVAAQPAEDEVVFASSPGTTHVSAVDADGMVAGATTTLGFGAGEFLPGTGVQLNNMLAEYDHRLWRAPGRTVPSMMSPTVLQGPTSTVCIGSAGAERIPQAIAQVLARMWTGATLDEAIASPRFVWDGASLHAEPGFDELLLERLESERDLVRWPQRHAFFGTTSGVAMRGGAASASGDLRREGIGRSV